MSLCCPNVRDSTHSVLRGRASLIEQRMDGQSWPLAAGGVSGFRSSGSIEPHFHDLAATTTSARSASPGRRTTTSADHYHQYHSRRRGPALPTGGDAGQGWKDAVFSNTSRS